MFLCGLGKNGKPSDEAVLIMNNYEMQPTILPLRLFAQRLALIDRIIDINLNGQKFPLMLLCDQKQRLTLKNLFLKYDGNEPAIFADKNFFTNGTKVEALNTRNTLYY